MRNDRAHSGAALVVGVVGSDVPQRPAGGLQQCSGAVAVARDHLHHGLDPASGAALGLVVGVGSDVAKRPAGRLQQCSGAVDGGLQQCT